MHGITSGHTQLVWSSIAVFIPASHIHIVIYTLVQQWFVLAKTQNQYQFDMKALRAKTVPGLVGSKSWCQTNTQNDKCYHMIIDYKLGQSEWKATSAGWKAGWWVDRKHFATGFQFLNSANSLSICFHYLLEQPLAFPMYLKMQLL
jgi:hypothetical protein